VSRAYGYTLHLWCDQTNCRLGQEIHDKSHEECETVATRAGWLLPTKANRQAEAYCPNHVCNDCGGTGRVDYSSLRDGCDVQCGDCNGDGVRRE